MPPGAELLTVRDVATQAGVSDDTVRSWVHGGYLPAVRVGPRGRMRFRPADVEAALHPVEPDPAAVSADDGCPHPGGG